MKKHKVVIIAITISLLSGCSLHKEVKSSNSKTISSKKQENKMFSPRNSYEQKILDTALEDFDKAIFFVNENLKAHPNSIRPYYIRAIVYGYWGDKLKNKEYASLSWNDYTFCINKAKSNEYKISKSELAELYTRRGTMSMLGNAHAQGIADYEMSCKIKKQKCKGLDFLRVLYLKN